MDGDRFDDLSRRLAVGLSRRKAVKGAVAGALGALGLRTVADAQVVTQSYCGNVVCVGNACVCKPGCVCCSYANGNSRCRPPGTCSSGRSRSAPRPPPRPHRPPRPPPPRPRRPRRRPRQPQQQPPPRPLPCCPLRVPARPGRTIASWTPVTATARQGASAVQASMGGRSAWVQAHPARASPATPTSIAPRSDRVPGALSSGRSDAQCARRPMAASAHRRAHRSRRTPPRTLPRRERSGRPGEPCSGPGLPSHIGCTGRGIRSI